jgi:general secretion pathway protein D
METNVRPLNTVLLGLLLFLAAVTASAEAIVSIHPPMITEAPGSEFSINIDIANVSDLFAFQFDLSFGPTILSATSITEGTFLPGGGTTFFIAGAINESAGVISSTADSLIGPIPGITGNGALAEVQFTALATGMSTVTLSNVLLLDSNLAPISSSVADGVVDVKRTSVVPEPSAVILLGTALMLAVLTAGGSICIRRL